MHHHPFLHQPESGIITISQSAGVKESLPFLNSTRVKESSQFQHQLESRNIHQLHISQSQGIITSFSISLCQGINTQFPVAQVKESSLILHLSIKESYQIPHKLQWRDYSPIFYQLGLRHHYFFTSKGQGIITYFAVTRVEGSSSFPYQQEFRNNHPFSNQPGKGMKSLFIPPTASLEELLQFPISQSREIWRIFRHLETSTHQLLIRNTGISHSAGVKAYFPNLGKSRNCLFSCQLASNKNHHKIPYQSVKELNYYPFISPSSLE